VAAPLRLLTGTISLRPGVFALAARTGDSFFPFWFPRTERGRRLPVCQQLDVLDRERSKRHRRDRRTDAGKLLCVTLACKKEPWLGRRGVTPILVASCVHTLGKCFVVGVPEKASRIAWSRTLAVASVAGALPKSCELLIGVMRGRRACRSW